MEKMFLRVQLQQDSAHKGEQPFLGCFRRRSSKSAQKGIITNLKIMPKKKEETPIEEVVLESEEKKAYRELIERYAEQNPVKYAQKKEALEAKLNAMK